MKAYAIFDGGGVKGAAFAGCLIAAEQRNIEFLGYGGTSAGSIVALLAYLGYDGKRIENMMVNEVDFSSFLDDKGAYLNRIKSIQFPPLNAKPLSIWKWGKLYWSNKDILKLITTKLGLYEGNELKEFLARKVWEVFSDLENNYDFTFSELRHIKEIKHGKSIPLKVVASDLNRRTSVVYSDGSNGKDKNMPVLDAIRASISYPFVFRPVPLFQSYLVDGGLSINLPIHIFEYERKQQRHSIVAFDLIEKKPLTSGDYSIKKYFGDMLETALSSSEHLLHLTVQGVYQVPIITEGIDTLDFSISKDDKKRLSTEAHSQATTFFHNQLRQFESAGSPIQKLQAQYAPPRVVEPVLKAIANEFEHHTGAENVRCSIMLPMDDINKIVVYQYGMDDNPDSDLMLPIESGCSGRAWIGKHLIFADLEKAQSDFEEWGMNREQQSKIPKDRMAILSAPIFDYSSGVYEVRNIDELPVLGAISIDTTTKLEETEWMSASYIWVQESIKNWGEILSRILI